VGMARWTSGGSRKKTWDYRGGSWDTEKGTGERGCFRIILSGNAGGAVSRQKRREGDEEAGNCGTWGGKGGVFWEKGGGSGRSSPDWGGGRERLEASK